MLACMFWLSDLKILKISMILKIRVFIEFSLYEAEYILSESTLSSYDCLQPLFLGNEFEAERRVYLDRLKFQFDKDLSISLTSLSFRGLF